MKTIKYIIFSLTIVLSLIGCKEKTTTEVVTEQAKDHLVKIAIDQFESGKFEIQKLQLQDFKESIELNGFIDVPPNSKASVATLIEGYVKNSNLLEGDQVKKGQHLLSIESPSLIDVQQQFLEVKEQLTYLKNDFERQKALFDENISSQKKFLLAESTYRSSLAKFTGLENKLQLYGINLSEVAKGNFTKTIRINAPISGVVSKINIVKGDFVSPSQALLELMNIDHMHLELQAFERDIHKIKKGQEIQFKIPESSQESYPGKVHLVGATVNQQTKTVAINGHIDEDYKQDLVAGMYIEAAIIIKTDKLLAIDKEAIIKNEGATYVLIFKNMNDDFYNFERLDVSVIQEGEQYTTLEEIDQLKDAQILTKGAFMFNKD